MSLCQHISFPWYLLIAAMCFSCSGDQRKVKSTPPGGFSQSSHLLDVKMVKIPAGSFTGRKCSTTDLRCPKGDSNVADETLMDCAPKDVVCTNWIWDHKVTLTNSFFLSATEVTQRQYQVLMGENPSKYQSTLDKKRYLNHPVEQVSWFDAVRFANALSAAQGLPQCYDEDGKVIGERSIYECKGYRLPTSAEWEHAVRAGSKAGQDDDLARIAWYDLNTDNETKPVGQKQANAFGLYDTLGNVWEWCHDGYQSLEVRDGRIPLEVFVDPVWYGNAGFKVSRGGSYYDFPASVNVRYVYPYQPGERARFIGFRLARSASGNDAN